MPYTYPNRQINLSSLLLFVSLVAITCGVLRVSIMNQWYVISFVASSILAGLLGGFLAFLAVGRRGFIAGIVLGMFLLIFVGLLGLPWELWFPSSL